MTMHLLGSWGDLANKSQNIRALMEQPIMLPPILPKLASQIQFLKTQQACEEAIQTLQSLRIRAIPIDTEYRYSTPLIKQPKGKQWGDTKARIPIAISLAAWTEPTNSSTESQIIQYVIDLRNKELTPFVLRLLELRATYLFHNLKAEFHTFWVLGINPNFQCVYDTFVAAAALHLGRFHPRSPARKREDNSEDVTKKTTTEKRAHLLSLVGQCEHYKLPYPFSEDKDELRDLFLNLANDRELDERMIRYAASDAEWTLRLYIAQMNDVIFQGLHRQLYEVEFRFAIANARMEWNGVLLSAEKRALIKSGCEQAVRHYKEYFNARGVENPNSRIQIINLLQQMGLATHIKKITKTGSPSLEEKVLKNLENVDPIFSNLLRYKRYQGLLGEDWLLGAYTGIDQRVHPDSRQFGAQTGRNSCANPNLVGIGKMFRPVVVAPLGRAIFEADYSQVEVGIAGAEYDDATLIAAYNSGDVYSYMAKQFYFDILTDAERQLTLNEFKAARKDLRNVMKTFVLAVIYNAQAETISTSLGITVLEAARLREKFLNMFPRLKQSLEESSVFGLRRGYANTVLGLKRHLEMKNHYDQWTTNSLRNTPIQGSATTVFKKAVIMIDDEFQNTDAKIILTAHDAVIIECDEKYVDDVASRVEFLMRHAIRSIYPKLDGKVEINKLHTACWNKDGHFNSIERFLNDPNFKL